MINNRLRSKRNQSAIRLKIKRRAAFWRRVQEAFEKKLLEPHNPYLIHSRFFNNVEPMGKVIRRKRYEDTEM